MSKKVIVEGWSTRKRVGQSVLLPLPKRVVVPRVVDPVKREFAVRRSKLRELHKSLNAGLVDPACLTLLQKQLLKKYYGHDEFDV